MGATDRLPGNGLPFGVRRQAVHSKISAFTLVELLVSTAVLSVLVLLLSQVFSHASKSWLAGEGGAEHRRNERALADFIGDELRQALLPVEGQSTGSGGNLQFLVNPPASRLPANCQHADAIFWQAPLATETSFGDIAVVGYFVQWQGGKAHLCRLFVNPSSFAADGGVIKNPDHRIYDAADADAWLSVDLVERLVRPADKAGGYRGLFAENVPGFWVRCFGPDGQELPSSYDSRVGYDAKFRTPAGTVVSQKCLLPTVVEVSFAQVDSRHSARLADAETAVKAIIAGGDVHDAGGFMAKLQAAAVNSPLLAQLLPGIRTHTKEIRLQNAQ